MKLDFQHKEITIKLVYYGPSLSGKTTNLCAIHKLVSQKYIGDLVTLETKDDRTLFFDFFPLQIESASGIKIKIRLFTVPGQVIHNATRRMVLQGTDGVAFIADSQIDLLKLNVESFINLKENLAYNGFQLKEMPLVIQYNKRDLPNIRSDEDINKLASMGKEPVFKAIATNGIGVIDTFIKLVEITLKDIDKKHQIVNKFRLNIDDILKQLLLYFKK